MSGLYSAIFANIQTQAYACTHTYTNLASCFSQVDVGVVVLPVFRRRCGKLLLWPDFLWQELLEHVQSDTHMHTSVSKSPSFSFSLSSLLCCFSPFNTLAKINLTCLTHILLYLCSFIFPHAHFWQQSETTKAPTENAVYCITCRCVSSVAKISKMCVTILL